MQTELKVPVRISEVDFDDTQEVDLKLIKLAKLLNGKVVTTDYNLNKVASVHKVDVFNINELSNAVKPVLLPGEELKCTIIKDGKEQRQGIAYLEDGTMIVVEGGRGRIGPDDFCKNQVARFVPGNRRFQGQIQCNKHNGPGFELAAIICALWGQREADEKKPEKTKNTD
jgi:hypothetical protein